MLCRRLLSLWAAMVCLSSCGAHTLSVLSYNVSNLFDGVDDGTEYAEFDPGRGKWNDALFRQKLKRVAVAIRRASPEGADLVLLQEIENERALAALQAELAPAVFYRFMTIYDRAASGSAAGATVAVLSKLPLSRVSVHTLPAWERHPLREILEVRLNAAGENFIVFNNHWKAKTEGGRTTEAARLAAAGLLTARLREIKRREPETTILVAGDLNTRHDEYERTGGRYQTALLPSNDHVPEVYFIKSLALCGRPEEAGLFGEKITLFEPWLIHTGEVQGSYVYNRRWETLDHILYLPGKSAFFFKDFRVPSDPDLLDPRTGFPLAWDRRRPARGCSDHLPVLFLLEKK